MAVPDINELNACRKEAYELLEHKKYRQARELFESVSDGADLSIASCLGFIHSRLGSSEYHPTKAIDYYFVAARSGDSYAQYALGALLMEAGDADKALDWFTKASSGNLFLPDLGHIDLQRIAV